MSKDEFVPLGGIIDPLEHNSYEIDNSSNIFEAMGIIKSQTKPASDASEWIKIKKPELVSMIVDAYVDPEKKKILNVLSDKAFTIPEILDKCNLDSTKGYRKTKSLIKDGLIKPVGIAPIRNRKKTMEYLAIIDDVKIYIDRDIISVLVRFKKKIIQSKIYNSAPN